MTKDFMIMARIESFILGNGLEDAIEITSASYSNLAVKLGLNYEGNADITVAAKSSDGTFLSFRPCWLLPWTDFDRTYDCMKTSILWK